MPTPHKGQTEKEFMGICMGYPDMQKYDASQRAAICHSKWKEHLKAMAEEWASPLEVCSKQNFGGHGRLLCPSCRAVIMRCRCMNKEPDRICDEDCDVCKQTKNKETSS